MIQQVLCDGAQLFDLPASNEERATRCPSHLLSILFVVIHCTTRLIHSRLQDTQHLDVGQKQADNCSQYYVSSSCSCGRPLLVLPIKPLCVGDNAESDACGGWYASTSASTLDNPDCIWASPLVCISSM